MKEFKPTLIASIALIVAAVFFTTGCNFPSATTDANVESQTDLTPSTAETPQDLNAPQYVKYNESDNEIGQRPVVLSFHADWCPTCQSIKAKITEDLPNFPAGTKIIEVNYDTATDLKQKYGVNVQTTFVVLDASGEVVEKMTVPSLSQIKAAIEKSATEV